MKNSIITVYDQTYEAVTVTEAKARLKIVDRTDFDLDVKRLIKVATQWLERRYGIAILTQTREQRQDNFEFKSMDSFSSVALLYPPVQSVTSVNYTNEAGTVTPLTVTTEYVATGIQACVVGAQDILKASIYPVTSWPATKSVPEAVKIVYVCGYGATPSYVPEPIRESILRLVVFMFENPMDETTGSGEVLNKFEMCVSSFMSTYEQFGHVYDESKYLEHAR